MHITVTVSKQHKDYFDKLTTHVVLQGSLASLSLWVFPAQLNLQARPLVKTVASILLIMHVALVPPTKAKRAIY